MNATAGDAASCVEERPSETGDCLKCNIRAVLPVLVECGAGSAVVFNEVVVGCASSADCRVGADSAVAGTGST